MTRLSKVILAVALAVALYATVMQVLLWREHRAGQRQHWTITAKTVKTVPEKPVATLIVPIRGVKVGLWEVATVRMIGPDGYWRSVVLRYPKVATTPAGAFVSKGNLSAELTIGTYGDARALAWALSRMADEVEADKREERGR